MDDDAELAHRYRRVLESSGYAVEWSACDEGAVRLASEGKFDVVVGDLDLRVHGEAGTLKGIHDRCGNLPVVLLSNGLAFASARAAVACGAHRYLLKPVTEEQLLEVLVETIRETSRRPHS